MATLTLRDVPDQVHERLRERAARNRRSLNAEAVLLLELGIEWVPDEAELRSRYLSGAVGRATEPTDAEYSSATTPVAVLREAATGRPAPERRVDLEGQLRDWAEGSGCRLCVLFGSRGGGGPAVEGDVDVALDFGQLPPPQRRLEIIGHIQSLCGGPRADVVFLHAGTDPVLRFEIFRTGVLLYESEPVKFVDEKVRALMLYEDALPFRRLLRAKVQTPPDGAPHDA